MNDTVRAFIDRINAHDVAGLAELMSDNHTFIDAHGNEVTGKEKMTAGWRAYFDWFPDYYIEVTDVFENGDTFALFGFAGGSFRNRQTESWRVPAVWKAVVRKIACLFGKFLRTQKFHLRSLSATAGRNDGR